MEGWVDFDIGYIHAWFTCRQLFTHSGTNDVIATHDFAIVSATPFRYTSKPLKWASDMLRYSFWRVSDDDDDDCTDSSRVRGSTARSSDRSAFPQHRLSQHVLTDLPRVHDRTHGNGRTKARLPQPRVWVHRVALTATAAASSHLQVGNL